MFIDTNLFVAACNALAPDNERARASLARAQADAASCRISRQVMREYLAAATRPQTWSRPLSANEALSDLSWMEEAFEVLEDGPQVMDLLARLCRDIPVGGKQVHDANIVATMLAYGERRLLTFNVRDFRRFAAHIEILDPADTA